MSVLLRFYTVSDLDIADIKDEPKRLEILHYGETLDPSSMDDFDEDKKDQILKWTPKSKPNILYVEGMFQSVHYLLTSQSQTNLGTFPLNFLNGKRHEMGEIGWGPVTFYNSNDVQVIATALNELDFSQLEKKYKADFFNKSKIYPRGYNWTNDDVNSLLQKTEEIVTFLNKTKNNNLGMYRVFV
jgi:hypothetical protein